MAEKLSERMKRLYRPALDVNFIPEVEALENERDTLKKDYDRDTEWWAKTNTAMAELKQRAESAEAEVKRLSEENNSLSQWKSTGFTEFSKLKAEVKTLKAKADELDDLKDPTKPFPVTGDFGHAQQEYLKFEEAKARLAKAQDILKEIGTPVIRNVGWDKPQKQEVCFSTELWDRLGKALGDE
jgi:predicted nuclease with TOPRIM domain